MQKTIALVANTTWNIYNFRLSLMRRLKQQGYRVLVIAPVDEYIHYLNDRVCDRHIPLHWLRPQTHNPLSDLLLLRELYRIYRRERPDLVLHYTIKPNIYGSVAARSLSIPGIATVTGLGYTFLHQSLPNRLVRPLYRQALRGVARVLFHNPDDRALFIAEGLTSPQQSEVVPGSGVNTNFFRPLPQPAGNRHLFLFIGRLLADKGLREFVAAARTLRAQNAEVECWVVGELSPDNPAAIPQEEVFEWVEKQYIHYVGRARDVRPYIKRACALVLPSYREGMPRAVLEAMSMGKPIITTNVPGCRETVVHGKNGFLTPAGDARALTLAMEAFLQLSAAERQQWGVFSRAKVKREFDDYIVSKQYLRLAEQLLGEKAAAPAPAPTSAPAL